MLWSVLLLSVATMAAQNGKVTGTVYAESDREPLVGVTVHVEGTQINAVTDIDGRFTITPPKSAKLLTISYVGMASQTVAIAPNVVVYLKDDNNPLDEIVVTAYGTAKKSSVTGAISAVKSDKIENRITSSVTSALEGNVTGVQFSGQTGQPGDSPSIRIRGIGTVTGSTSPLYVIDGVPMDANVSDLNPVDIESMSVLKDAASCALYGSRAANGVILITTKKGKGDGTVSLNLRINQGWYTRGIKEYKGISPERYMEARWQLMRNSKMSMASDPLSYDDACAYASANLMSTSLYLNIFNVPDDKLFTADGKLNSGVFVNPRYAGDLDWFDQGTRKGYRQEYTVSGSAATKRSNTYFSLGYLDEDGYTTTANFNRLTGRVSTSLTPVKYLTVGLNLTGSHQNSSYTPDTDGSITSIFSSARSVAPIYPVHLHDPFTGEYALDVNGNRQYDPGYFIDEDGNQIYTRNTNRDRHVIWENELNHDKTVRNTLQGTAYADVKFLKDFTFTVKGNLSIRHNNETEYQNATIGDGKGDNARLYSYKYRYKSYSAHEMLNYRHTFNKVHYVEALAAHENYYYNYNYGYTKMTGETFPGGAYEKNFSNMGSINGYDNNYRTESYLGRIRYSYDDRYNLEASFRRDGTSRFANKWGNFGSIGVNWVITNESFMKNIEWISNTVLRLNWGQVGSDSGSGYYDYMALYTSKLNNGMNGYYISNLENRDLKWETAESWGIGLDTRLFNRWNLTVEYFDKRNKDLLFDVQNPMSAGGTSVTGIASSITRNIGTISNRGIEIATDVDIYSDRNWTVNFQANATIIKNKVIKLPDQNKEGIVDGTKKIREGHDRYQYWLRDWAGVDQMTGRSLYLPDTENQNYFYRKADGTVVGDANGVDITDEIVTINGKAYTYNHTYAKYSAHGSSLPKVYGAFGLNLRWRSLKLSTLFTYALGGKVYDGIYRSLMSAGATPSNLHADAVKSWNGVPKGVTATSANRIAPKGIPMLDENLSSSNNASSSRWLVSGDYLQCKNISLQYSLPRSWTKAMNLQGIELFANIENAFLVTARRGLNPQQTVTGSVYDGMVPPRTYSLGINVKF